MPLRPPPRELAAPNLSVLEAGSILHRVHDRAYGTTDFNPCQGSPTRFAPIADPAGDCVPSMYAGSTLESAIFETIFHDVPAAAARKTVPAREVTMRAHGELELLRPLSLVALRNADLKKWRITRNALISSPPTHYQATVRWAEAIYRQFPHAEGLVWTSNLCDPDDAYLFFGGRVAPGDLHVVSVRDGQRDKSFLADARVAGQRAGIVITT